MSYTKEQLDAAQKVDDFFIRLTKGIGLKPETVGTIPLGFENAKRKFYFTNIPMPELGVSEFLGLDRITDASKRIDEANKKKEEEAEKEDLGDAVGDTKTLKTLAGEMFLRDFENRLQNRRDLNLISQTMPIIDTYAQTASDRRLTEDRFSPTKISQQRLRAQSGEAALMQAIANQASAAAQIGSLGTGRRYGR